MLSRTHAESHDQQEQMLPDVLTTHFAPTLVHGHAAAALRRHAHAQQVSMQLWPVHHCVG